MEFIKNGTPIELSKTEQKLLRILIDNQGNTVSRDRLIDSTWTTDGAEYVGKNALAVTVKRLRNKLEDSPPLPNTLKQFMGGDIHGR